MFGMQFTINLRLSQPSTRSVTVRAQQSLHEGLSALPPQSFNIKIITNTANCQ